MLPFEELNALLGKDEWDAREDALRAVRAGASLVSAAAGTATETVCQLIAPPVVLGAGRRARDGPPAGAPRRAARARGHRRRARRARPARSRRGGHPRARGRGRGVRGAGRRAHPGVDDGRRRARRGRRLRRLRRHRRRLGARHRQGLRAASPRTAASCWTTSTRRSAPASPCPGRCCRSSRCRRPRARAPRSPRSRSSTCPSTASRPASRTRSCARASPSAIPS